MDSPKSPWHILGSKAVYDNKWISVTEFDVINPGGGRGIYGKIHFKKIAVGVLPMDKELNVYLVGQHRFPLNAYSWEIPEGGGEFGEDPLDSAKRELVEETGLVAGHWENILTMHLSNSVSDEYAILYLARDLVQKKARPEETEELAIRKLSFDQAYQMVEQGEITDSMSVATIQKVRLMFLDGRIKKEILI